MSRAFGRSWPDSAVGAAAVGEEEQPRQRRRLDELRDGVALARLDGLRAPTALGARLHVSARRDGDDERLVVDERLGGDLAAIVGDDLRAPVAAVRVADRDQLVADHAHQHVALGEDPAQLLDLGGELLALGDELVATELREPAEREVEDVVGLDLAVLEPGAHEARCAPRRDPSTP